jgi:hypothetical protein
MSWSIGYDESWKRDIGYGVPALCDHPDCNVEINRGLSYVCANEEPYGGNHGCGLYFCEMHRGFIDWTKGEICAHKNIEAKPDIPMWIDWKLTDKSWQRWRDENPDEVAKMRATQVRSLNE